ncbi:MAG: Glu/Leu/Phe/Val dehydrogenase dimerization domain-containing protein [Dehalococcoidia bacterium]|nr:Glu/Leu/Phe/Val dehydrogenase dimerization domain-containing protein [Dehalococcoidia bacterium]
MQQFDYEQLLFCNDSGVGLKALICIHDTTLGPALGGVRMRNYPSEEDAVMDALRLGRAMTYKAAASGLDLGGGKAVVIGDPLKDKTEALFKALGRHVASLGGRYIATEDVGTTTRDMEYLRTQTPFVVGLPEYMNGSGDPSPATAFGVMKAMEACCKATYGSSNLKNRTIAIQGAGKVGSHLARLLNGAGAKLLITDINKTSLRQVVKETGATALLPEDILKTECDILSPCAFGGILDSSSIASLRCKIIVGAANNQLKEADHGEEIHKKGILYCPDYIANAGGIINLSLELTGYDAAAVRFKLEGIYTTTEQVIKNAEKGNISTSRAADNLAEDRLRQSKIVKNIFFNPLTAKHL